MDKLLETKTIFFKIKFLLEKQEQEIQRRERELDSTVRRPAEAEKYRLEKIAEANRNRLIMEAEADAEAEILRGEAKAFAIEARAKAEAEQVMFFIIKYSL